MVRPCLDLSIISHMEFQLHGDGTPDTCIPCFHRCVTTLRSSKHSSKLDTKLDTLSGLSIASTYMSYSSTTGCWKPQFSQPFVILSVTLNITLTAMIIGRLLFLRNRIREFGKQHSRIYSNLAAMFFESGALYSVMGIIYLVSLISEHIDMQYMFLLPYQQSVVSLCTSLFCKFLSNEQLPAT
jgi:hypothetical protein